MIASVFARSLRHAESNQGEDMKKIALGLAVAALLAISAATAMTASAAAIIIRDTFTVPTSRPA
jgi:hypothetical protein